MVRERSLEVCALNLAANPHPDRVYVTILANASQLVVKARGSDYAKITAPKAVPDRRDVYVGRIIVWTEIDLRSPWFDLRNEDELSPKLKRSINIPDNAKPNMRAFGYVFYAKSHKLYFESKNETGERLGPNVARSIFSKITSQELLGYDSPEVEVTIVPDVGAVERVLRIPRLRMLFIRVTLPNPDTSSPAARKRIYDRLKKAHARQLEEKYTKSSDAERLSPTPDIQELAKVAAENGFVRGEGRGDDGKKLEVSTEKFPKRLFVSISGGSSLFARLMSAFPNLE